MIHKQNQNAEKINSRIAKSQGNLYDKQIVLFGLFVIALIFIKSITGILLNLISLILLFYLITKIDNLIFQIHLNDQIKFSSFWTNIHFLKIISLLILVSPIVTINFVHLNCFVDVFLKSCFYSMFFFGVIEFIKLHLIGNRKHIQKIKMGLFSLIIKCALNLRQLSNTNLWFSYIHSLTMENGNPKFSLWLLAYLIFKISFQVFLFIDLCQTVMKYSYNVNMKISHVHIHECKTSNQNDSDQLICSICLNEPEDPVKLVECGHVFCSECLYRWIIDHPSCPFCRAKVAQPELIDLCNGVIALPALLCPF